MTEFMTASDEVMTDGQIENAVSKLRDAIRRHRSEISSRVAQQVLGVENLGMLMFAVFRRRVEAVSNLIRRVKVNRTCTPQEALDATGRTQYTDATVVENMPKGVGEEAEVIFFKPEPSEYTRSGFMSDDDLEKCFERRVLTSADPYSVAAVNEADSAFADKMPHGTHWKDAEGKWCFAAFHQWSRAERYVDVRRSDDGWRDRWWFAGLRKPARLNDDSRSGG